MKLRLVTQSSQAPLLVFLDTLTVTLAVANNKPWSLGDRSVPDVCYRALGDLWFDEGQVRAWEIDELRWSLAHVFAFNHILNHQYSSFP